MSTEDAAWEEKVSQLAIMFSNLTMDTIQLTLTGCDGDMDRFAFLISSDLQLIHRINRAVDELLNADFLGLTNKPTESDSEERRKRSSKIERKPGN